MSVISLQRRANMEEQRPDFRGGAGLELDLLRTLVAIADTGSFNRAARAVFRTPSAVSMQMKKLEEQVERSLFAKDGRSVILTPDGETLVGYSRRILKLAEEAVRRFRGPEIEGKITLGAPDDYIGFLPGILSRFAASHPNVEVDVLCQPTNDLLDRLENGTVDIALLSSGHGQKSGMAVHREPLVWAGLRHGCAHERTPLPLALAHPGCCWRKQSLDALDEAGIAYRVAYTSRHYSGQLSAVLAGLAIAPFPKSVVRGDMKVLGEDVGLPPIGDFEIELRRGASATGPLYDALASHVVNSFRGYDEAAA